MSDLPQEFVRFHTDAERVNKYLEDNPDTYVKPKRSVCKMLDIDTKLADIDNNKKAEETSYDSNE